MTLADYLPIAFMLALAIVFVAVSYLISRFVAPRRPTPEKLAPYESGIIPEVEPAQRFPVQFYLVAMLFVIFDVEIVFLFAWAAQWDRLGWYGIGGGPFIGDLALLVGRRADGRLYYAQKTGRVEHTAWQPLGDYQFIEGSKVMVC